MKERPFVGFMVLVPYSISISLLSTEGGRGRKGNDWSANLFPSIIPALYDARSQLCDKSTGTVLVLV